MPTVRVTIPKNDLDSDQKAKLIATLTDVVADFFKEEKGEDVKQFVMVQVSETAEGGYALGGQVIG